MELALGSYAGLNRFIKLLRTMQIEEDLDCMIGVSGFKGFGKSTFSIGCAKRIVEGVLKQKFRIQEYTAYSLQDTLRMANTLPDYSPLVCDEAVNFAMGEDWMISEHKHLKRVMAKIRTRHLIFFFNIPDLWWLDKKYRENMMTVWIHIIEKGKVIMALPNLVPALEDRWNRDWLLKKFRKIHWNFFSDPNIIMRILRKYPCYFDEFAFPKLPQPLYRQHIKLREEQIFKFPERKHMIKRFIAVLPYYNLKNNGQSMSFREAVNKIYWNPLTEKPAISHVTLKTMYDEFVKSLNVK